jgi:hypothetical protein
MIDDMASLKKAMEQMDAADVAASQAAKDQAAQILSEAKLSFSKLAEMIEERRLLLRPRIVAGIKRMDQPDMLGDAAFRDTSILLRREGQSFRKIADAIEFNGRPVPRHEEPVQTSEPLYPIEMESESSVPGWLRGVNFVARITFFPLRHPIRFLAIALLAILLFNFLRGSGTVGQQVSGYFADVSTARQRVDSAISSASSLLDKRILRRSQEAAAPPTLPTPIPSPPAAEPSPSAPPSSGTATASAPPATTPAPSATAPAPSPSASPASPWTVPAAPPASTPRLDARSVPPSSSAANDRSRTARLRTFEDMIPDGSPRNSRMAGPCIRGVGGCYWGGGRY